MAQKIKAKSPRVFISYASEDQSLVLQLQADLQRDGVNVVFVDKQIEPGDSIVEKINAGLKCCDTLVLIWSKYAARSFGVREEWETALYLQRRIIPCVVRVRDNTVLPPLLSRRLHINFFNYDEGYTKLCKALGVTLKNVDSFPQNE